ncbi:MAG: flippase-like domain-containing protein [Eggerthellaceae bacterium]|nr:flippase-like domain-containing protein [Eggerthellaceae bacterium]
MDDAHQTDELMPESDRGSIAPSSATGQLYPVNASPDNEEEDVYADAGHWMHSISSDSTNSDESESGLKLDLTDIDLTAIADDEKIPDKGTAHSLGRKVNIALCAIAFVVMFGYLFIAGEGEQTLNAFASFNYSFLLIALVGIVVYWLLEAVCMQIICNDLFRGFSFFKTFLVTVIGQYFNCITPLSSGGQPMQAYYYQRFGLPVEHAMPMLLCRFIVYQMTMTVYAIIVLILRFGYFMHDLRPIMYLVAIGFVGGFVLMAMLLTLAFAKNGVIRVTTWVINLLGRIGIFKDADSTLKAATKSLEESYEGMQFLLKRPSVLIRVSLVTFVQLTVFFSLSWVIFAGFGLEANDYFTVVSCQAFVYLIMSFVPLPGAIGASEASYITFFNYVYGDPAIVALTTFIWRFFTFYLPIVLGMTLTLLVNKESSALARWIRRDDARMAFTDHTVVRKEKKSKAKSE